MDERFAGGWALPVAYGFSACRLPPASSSEIPTRRQAAHFDGAEDLQTGDGASGFSQLMAKRALLT